MANMYIIAGCNGSGKTTASFTVLPEMLNCREFVNADSIAAGLSPLQPASVTIEAGRIMLQRIKQLLSADVDFAFETTLATRSYVPLIKEAHEKGYRVNLLYFWLASPQFAKQRVQARVKQGGHNIDEDVIERRYYRGIKNLLELYMPVVDEWTVINNMGPFAVTICKGLEKNDKTILNSELWGIIQQQSKHAN